MYYARHVGAERAAAEVAEARVKGPEPLTADEARAAAAAEGLELVPSSSNETGFRSVVKHGGKYKVQIRENGKTRHLGIFATPEEAALCYARHIGAERAAARAAEARVKGREPLTAYEARAEARAASAAEGLELVPSSCNERGSKGVCDLVDGWLIPGRRPPHRPVLKAPAPGPAAGEAAAFSPFDDAAAFEAVAAAAPPSAPSRRARPRRKSSK